MKNGSLPMHRLKHVEKPTTLITDKIQRIDAREEAHNRAQRGDYGAAVKEGMARLLTRDPLSAAQVDVVRQLASIKDNEVASTKAPITEDPVVLSHHLKRLGYFLGADIMGICRLPKYAVYSYDPDGNPLNLDYPFAIVIVRAKELQTVKVSQGYDWVSLPLGWQAYMPVAFIAHTMSNYIRRLGYQASPQHAGRAEGRRYQVLIPPLLLWAGIGEVSRVGIILNPFLGLGFKAAAILTNMPLEPDKPIDFGLQNFCQHCKICASECPGKAIPTGDKIMHNGYETWKLDVQRCASFNFLNKKGNFCNTCVKVCPWTRPTTWPHNLVRWAVEHSRVAERVAIRTDNILRRRKKKAKGKWWFDLEYLDGILRSPPQ